MEVINPPQIKVDAIRKGGGVKRTLLLTDLNSQNPVGHIQTILQKIKDKFIDGGIAKVKLDEHNPVIFTVFPVLGNDVYRFTISFPAGMEDIQKSLMTGISKFVNG